MNCLEWWHHFCLLFTCRLCYLLHPFANSPPSPLTCIHLSNSRLCPTPPIFLRFLLPIHQSQEVARPLMLSVHSLLDPLNSSGSLVFGYRLYKLYLHFGWSGKVHLQLREVLGHFTSGDSILLLFNYWYSSQPIYWADNFQFNFVKVSVWSKSWLETDRWKCHVWVLKFW